MAQYRVVPSSSTFSFSKYTFLWWETFCLEDILRRINWANVNGKKKYCLKLGFLIEGQFSKSLVLNGVLAQNKYVLVII